MATVTINDRVFMGDHFTIRAGEIFVDGVRQDVLPVFGVVDVRIEGILQRLNTDGSVTCGDVHTVTAGGNVSCRDVTGPITAGGGVTASSVLVG